MSAPDTENKTSNEGLTVSRLIKWLTYPIAAVSGFWAANVSVHNNAYNTAKTLGAFDDILDVATPKSISDLHQGVVGKISTAECYARSIENKLNYQKLADERMAKIGLDSFRSKWNYMAKANKQDAVLIGMTVFGIAIGALFAISESKTLNNLISSEKKDSSLQK